MKRNQTRDYLDVAALGDRFGSHWAAGTLVDIDAYYNEGVDGETSVAGQVLRQLGAPRPQDSRATTSLDQYKDLVPRWRSWDAVVRQCQVVADAMIT